MNRRTLLAALPWLGVARHLAAAETVKVVASFSILADMTQVVGGEAVTVASLVPVDGDAHQYQPTPSDLTSIHAAVALVENGLGLEGWMARLPQAAGFKGVRIVAGAAVTPRQMEEDGRSITDPHAWQDPTNAILYVRAIAAGLAKALPDQATAIAARAGAYIAEIEATDRWISSQLAGVPREKRVILTSHDAFGYYGARYGVTLRFVQGISTEGEPSAADLAALIGQIKREHVRAVFVENMTDPRLAATVAREAGAVLGGAVYSDALSAAGGPAATYLEMLRHNTALFVAAMTGA